MAISKKPLPPLDRIRELLDYDPITGVLLWKVDRLGRGAPKAGQEAGTLAPSGYRVVCVDRVGYRSHRLAWFLASGCDPGEFEVDHVNMLRADNRSENLRLATHQQNKLNTRQNGNNTTGLKNISLAKHHKSKPYMVKMRIGGVQRNLGYYKNVDEAIKVRDEAINTNHGLYGRCG